MKLIEAMKKVKMNKEKIADLQNKIRECSANLSHETPLYKDQTQAKISGWVQTCQDLCKDNVDLLVKIQKTNIQTMVTIQLGENNVEKSISEWVWRRREYAEIEQKTFACLSDRGLKEGFMNQSTGQAIQVTIVRHFDPEWRDHNMSILREEPHKIDAALEVVNAVTDLLE